MSLRENLRDALPDDQFNADALIARARRGPAQPPARRQWAAIGGALLLAIAAVATLVTVRSTHTTTPAHAPATASASPRPAAPLNNSFAGFLDYQFPAAESGWLHLFAPKGTTLVYHTADGGHHWAEQLREEGLDGPARLQAIDARQSVLVVNVNIAGTTPGPIRVYSTSDAGLNWRKTDGPRASLAASFFSSATEGWITTAAPAVAGSGCTPDASRVTLHHTSDGGAHWDTLNGTDGLTGDDNKGSLYFIDSKIGWPDFVRFTQWAVKPPLLDSRRRSLLAGSGVPGSDQRIASPVLQPRRGRSRHRQGRLPKPRRRGHLDPRSSTDRNRCISWTRIIGSESRFRA
jgi:hypothetical protein